MNTKREVLKIVEKVARVKVDEYIFRWPPICMGFLHQPKRPMGNQNVKTEKKEP